MTVNITFLGTNGWYDTSTGNTSCVLIESELWYIVLDAGNGIYKVDKYIQEQKPVFLFLSHLHLDHIIGLHILNKFNFPQGLRIFGQVGTKHYLENLVREPFTVPFDKLNYAVFLDEIAAGQYEDPVPVECDFLRHSSPCLGYRFSLDNRIITYCTDTGMCDNLIQLGKNADILITECSNPQGQFDESWPHLNPDDVKVLYENTGAQKIVLTHFDANNYQTMGSRLSIYKLYPEMKDRLFIAYDGFELVL